MSPRPHVVGVVGNDITMDARVRKVAAAAAAAGFRSTIVCYTSSGVRRQSRMGAVDVIRIPVPFRAHVKNGRVPGLLRPFNGGELAARHAGPRVHLMARRRRLEGELDAEGTKAGRRLLLKVLVAWTRTSLKVRHETFRIRRRANVEIDRALRVLNRTRVRTTMRLFRPFRDAVPNIADYEVAFGPVLEDLEPDLIHAHDYHMIGVAVTAARRLSRRGRVAKVVYDAHEWIEGLSYPPATLKGWLRLERRFIGHVDAVTGVSPEQVAQIQARYRLPSAPTVVLNAPVVNGTDRGTEDIRTALGVSGKIICYHGNVFLERGLGTLIDALALLDHDTHVAILAPRGNPQVEEIKGKASALGVSERVHILDYVPAQRLAAFISTADVAVIPYLSTGNNDIALPNKLFESVQAELPLLVSDMRSMSRLIVERGIGEVFAAGDPLDLATKARMVLAHPDRYRSRITSELKRELTWDMQAARLASVYGGLLGTGEPRTLTISASDITEDVDAVDYRPTRLAIGPRNMAGQAYAISAAVQAQLGIPAVSFSVEKPLYRFPVHVQVAEEQWRDPAWQAAQRRLLAHGFTHVIAESGTGLLGAMNGGFIDDQLDLLREDGLKVAVLLHGSEIRDPDRHRLLPYSPYAVDNELIRAMGEANARLRRHLDRVDAPVFVTTPDLLQDVKATWLPVVVDTDRWADLKPAFGADLPTVLHLPSNDALKGTEYIDRVLARFQTEGRIHYLRPDRTPAVEVPNLVEQADIVIDQIVIGAYGLMSVEAMAAGRLSIANVRDIGELASECPIVHADPGTLDQVLEDLLGERNGWTERAAAGRAFVSRYHDGSATADILSSFLGPI